MQHHSTTLSQHHCLHLTHSSCLLYCSFVLASQLTFAAVLELHGAEHRSNHGQERRCWVTCARVRSTRPSYVTDSHMCTGASQVCCETERRNLKMLYASCYAAKGWSDNRRRALVGRWSEWRVTKADVVVVNGSCDAAGEGRRETCSASQMTVLFRALLCTTIRIDDL